jgi:hypothetical protein
MFWPEHYATHSVINSKRVCKLSLYQYHANTRVRLSLLFTPGYENVRQALIRNCYMSTFRSSYVEAMLTYADARIPRPPPASLRKVEPTPSNLFAVQYLSIVMRDANNGSTSTTGHVGGT